MNKWIAVDLDGTLADLTHRLHFITDGERDWDSFFNACDKDVLIPNMRDIVVAMHRGGYKVLVLSGRSDAVMPKTVTWLIANNVPYTDLLMRSAGDHRPDYEVKQELLNNWLERASKRGQHIITTIFEDRKSVVDMWRGNNFHVCHVAEGDF